MTIGERIKQRRIELNMTQDELAKRTGYKPIKKWLKSAWLCGLTPSKINKIVIFQTRMK